MRKLEKKKRKISVAGVCFTFNEMASLDWWAKSHKAPQKSSKNSGIIVTNVPWIA